MTPPDPPVTLSIEGAASTIAYAEHQRLFAGRSTIELNEALASHVQAPYFRAAGGTGRARIFVLEDVVLDGETLLLSKDGRVISETAYFVPERAASTEPTAAPLGPGQVLVIACNNQDWAYHHWVAQCLPAIDWSLRHLRGPQGGQVPDRDIHLLMHDALPWQEEYLNLLGCAGLPRIKPVTGQRYRLPRVVFCEYLNGSASFDVMSSLAATIQTIVLAAPAVRSPARLLYVPNPGAYYGRIANEDAAVAVMRRYGVQPVHPGRMSVAETVSMFRQADAVIGPNGPHLANVLFARPGALLWELMPAHHQNAVFNRLAQTAQVDYWGDMSVGPASLPEGEAWAIDLDRLTERLERLVRRPVPPPPYTRGRVKFGGDGGDLPLDAVLMRFESLGDNCEFGIVQRSAGIEPLGLLRFNGFFVDPEERLPALVDALRNRFEGLGQPQNIQVTADGTADEAELMVTERAFRMRYHTWIRQDQATLEAQAAREVTRLAFLRRKLLQDLDAGEKICVWKSTGTVTTEQVRPLFDQLRRIGPNTLLWVTLADASHPAGSVEAIEPHFIRGHVERFAPEAAATDIHRPSWYAVCEAAYLLSERGKTVAPEQPGAPAAEPVGAPYSAMEYLARTAQESAAAKGRKRSFFSALWGRG